MTKPDYVGDTATAWEHELEAIQGNFGDPIWKCVICGEVWTEKEYYRDQPECREND